MFRYPDKPFHTIPASALTALGDGWIAQLKVDGWRCVIAVTATGPFIYTSRHNKPIPVSDECRIAFECEVRALKVPVGTVFDGEWTARRPAIREESIRLFDVLARPHDVRGEPFAWRLSELIYLMDGSPRIVPYWPAASVQFFRQMQNEYPMIGEGIVLKRASSKHIGAPDRCAENRDWARCKWRAGEDGLTRIEAGAMLEVVRP